MGAQGSGRFGRRGGRFRVEEAARFAVADYMTRLRDEYPRPLPWRPCHLYGVVAHPLTFWPTPQPFGGLRWWMVCPRCHKRRTALYMVLYPSPYGEEATWSDLRCRTCHRLAYTSSRTAPRKRAEMMAEKMYARAAGDGDAARAWDAVQKPLGKHWRTFRRELGRGRRYLEVANGIADSWLQRIRSARWEGPA